MNTILFDLKKKITASIPKAVIEQNFTSLEAPFDNLTKDKDVLTEENLNKLALVYNFLTKKWSLTTELLNSERLKISIYQLSSHQLIALKSFLIDHKIDDFVSLLFDQFQEILPKQSEDNFNTRLSKILAGDTKPLPKELIFNLAKLNTASQQTLSCHLIDGDQDYYNQIGSALSGPLMAESQYPAVRGTWGYEKLASLRKRLLGTSKELLSRELNNLPGIVISGSDSLICLKQIVASHLSDQNPTLLDETLYTVITENLSRVYLNKKEFSQWIAQEQQTNSPRQGHIQDSLANIVVIFDTKQRKYLVKPNLKSGEPLFVDEANQTVDFRLIKSHFLSGQNYDVSKIPFDSFNIRSNINANEDTDNRSDIMSEVETVACISKGSNYNPTTLNWMRIEPDTWYSYDTIVRMQKNPQAFSVYLGNRKGIFDEALVKALNFDIDSLSKNLPEAFSQLYEHAQDYDIKQLKQQSIDLEDKEPDLSRG